MASKPMAASGPPARAATATTVAPPRPVVAPVRHSPTTVRPVAAPKQEINLSPISRVEEKLRYPNFINTLGQDMYLVPTGQFRMGCETPDAQQNEQPVTPVILSAFHMCRVPITNGMYEKYDPTHRNKRGAWADDTHPVIYVI